MSIKFQAIQWFSKDEIDCESENESIKKFVIYCFGKDENGKNITCKIENYQPYYYIKVNESFTKNKLTSLLNFMEKFKSCHDSIDRNLSCIVEKKDIYGFNNEKIFKFVKVVFKNEQSFIKSKYIFKKPVQISGVNTKFEKFKLYESHFEPFIKMCHETKIQCSGWIQVDKFTKIQNYISVDYRNIKGIEENKIAPFLQASFDIEVYSFDYSFPNPLTKPNEIYQIATTLKNHNKDNLTKYLFTLKKVDKSMIQDTDIYECKDEKDLLVKWSKFINTSNPDILYSYNGDSFDFDYIYKRCTLYGNEFSEVIMKNLSRMEYYPAYLKLEKFSSSAYGDNDYSRLYIPGRVNYDLLIHYKRGMTKYSSYKLDDIATEVLNEGKHEVTAKDIFKFYEEGDPKKLSIIGNYCIQDTHLLQKLVDKQLILGNVIELSNITFVPLQYILIRGQTVKCMSQIIRKANSMGFIVPHTSFNEEKYYLKIKFKKEPSLKFEKDDYLTIRCSNTKFDMFFKVEDISESGCLNGHSDCDIFENEITHIVFKNKTFEINKDIGISSLESYEESFTGATVLEPDTGFYSDNVAILDFASLYPTIMMAYNLCFSTFIFNDSLITQDMDIYTMKWSDEIEIKLRQKCQGAYKSGKKLGEICGRQAFFTIENDKKKEYYCKVHDPLKKEREKNGTFQDIEHNYKIVQKDKDGKRVGVLPSLLEDLYTHRKYVKKLMNEAEKNGNKELSNIYNSTQNAIKISLNSIYGFLGRTTGNLTLKELGSIVTFLGRKLIETSKNYTENDFYNYINCEENCPRIQI